jgi:hypothetical protein
MAKATAVTRAGSRYQPPNKHRYITEAMSETRHTDSRTSAAESYQKANTQVLDWLDIMRDSEDESTLTLNIADKALMVFLRVVIEIEGAESLEQFKYHRTFAQRFTLPFQVKMGFGLHIGWAIEGFIGSKSKIDASYISPDVNMSEKPLPREIDFGNPTSTRRHHQCMQENKGCFRSMRRRSILVDSSLLQQQSSSRGSSNSLPSSFASRLTIVREYFA